MTDTSQPLPARSDTPDPAAPPGPAAKPARTPVTQKADWWGFAPHPEGTGPPPIPPRVPKAVSEPAAKPEPEPGADDTDTGPQIDAAPPEATIEAEAFTDAFGPPRQADDDGGGFTQDDYDALAAEYEDSDEGEINGEIRTDQATGDSEEPEPASRREARYRTRLRDTEGRLRALAAENVDLQNRLEAQQRAEAVRLASARLADPAADLFRDSDVEAVLHADGTVDPQRVNELADSILASHPHYAAPRVATDPNRLRSGAARADEVEPTSWQRAFAPRTK